jgi:hypothetical protein
MAGSEPGGRVVFLSVMTGLALVGELAIIGIGLSRPGQGALALGLSVIPLLMLALFGIPLLQSLRRRRSGR